MNICTFTTLKKKLDHCTCITAAAKIVLYSLEKLHQHPTNNLLFVLDKPAQISQNEEKSN